MSDQEILRIALEDILSGTSGQLEPSLTRLEEVLGEGVEAGSFALGMITAALVIQEVDAINCVGMFPEMFREYVHQCRMRRAVDRGPFRKGRVLLDIESSGVQFSEGQEILYRPTESEFWVEVQLSPTVHRLLGATAVAALD